MIELDLLVEIARVHGEKKPVYAVQLIPSEQLVLIISGKQRHVRLVPYLALEGGCVPWSVVCVSNINV